MEGQRGGATSSSVLLVVRFKPLGLARALRPCLCDRTHDDFKPCVQCRQLPGLLVREPLRFMRSNSSPPLWLPPKLNSSAEAGELRERFQKPTPRMRGVKQHVVAGQRWSCCATHRFDEAGFDFWFGIQEPVCGNRHLKRNAELRAAVILAGKEIES